ncbi:hypothetical protein DFH27DRAFT_521713 [Peziza echinospora]|nr:hypothetical protein DFH27DRAFT_521713 [Peziza echinospora]
MDRHTEYTLLDHPWCAYDSKAKKQEQPVSSQKRLKPLVKFRSSSGPREDLTIVLYPYIADDDDDDLYAEDSATGAHEEHDGRKLFSFKESLQVAQDDTGEDKHDEQAAEEEEEGGEDGHGGDGNHDDQDHDDQDRRLLGALCSRPPRVQGGGVLGQVLRQRAHTYFQLAYEGSYRYIGLRKIMVVGLDYCSPEYWPWGINQTRYRMDNHKIVCLSFDTDIMGIAGRGGISTSGMMKSVGQQFRFYVGISDKAVLC